MRRGLLAGLLAVQLVVIGLVWGLRTTGADVPEPFLAFEAEGVDAIEVGNAEGEVRLVLDGDQWRLPDGLPADGGKVERVLEKLGRVSAGWPVATSDATAERFEVTPERHQRHIVVKRADDTIADVYLGTSPGFRKVHARRADGGPVYSIEFSNYEAGTDASAWLDKSLLQPVGAVTSIERVGGFTLRNEDAGWSAEGAAALDQDKIEKLVKRLTDLNVLGTTDDDLPDDPKMRFDIGDEKGRLSLAIYHLEDDDDYVAVSDRIDGRFEISTFVAEQMDVTLEDLAPDEVDELIREVEAARDAGAGVGDEDGDESPES